MKMNKLRNGLTKLVLGGALLAGSSLGCIMDFNCLSANKEKYDELIAICEGEGRARLNGDEYKINSKERYLEYEELKKAYILDFWKSEPKDGPQRYVPSVQGHLISERELKGIPFKILSYALAGSLILSFSLINSWIQERKYDRKDCLNNKIFKPIL